MVVTDPIADYLTRIRNASRVKHRIVEIPASNIKKEITKILFDNGYILNYKIEDTQNGQGIIKIALKYDKLTRDSVIRGLDRVSKSGLRKYSSSKNIRTVLNGLGICVLSTSQGLMTGGDAKAKNIGGEVLFNIY